MGHGRPQMSIGMLTKHSDAHYVRYYQHSCVNLPFSRLRSALIRSAAGTGPCFAWAPEESLVSPLSLLLDASSRALQVQLYGIVCQR